MAAAQRGGASQVAGTGTATSRKGVKGSLGFGSLNVAVGSVEGDEVFVSVAGGSGGGGGAPPRRGCAPVRCDVAQHGSSWARSRSRRARAGR